MTNEMQKKAEEFAERLLKNFNVEEAANFVVACKVRASRCYENALDALDNTNFSDRGLSAAGDYLRKAEYWELVDGIISRKIGNVP